jgi:hypothetical protein
MCAGRQICCSRGLSQGLAWLLCLVLVQYRDSRKYYRAIAIIFMARYYTTKFEFARYGILMQVAPNTVSFIDCPQGLLAASPVAKTY